MTGNCSVALNWTAFSGYVPDAVLQFYVFYCCAVFIVGTICSLVALWCVVSCPRTMLPVKVILCALFSTTLLMCLLMMPFMAHLSLHKLWCDREISTSVLIVFIPGYVALNVMELFYIFVMALLRALAVWAPQRGGLSLRTAVVVVVGIGLYNLSINMVGAAFWKQISSEYTGKVMLMVSNVLHYFLPMLLTLACYLSIIVTVKRNKRKLAANQHAAEVTSLRRNKCNNDASEHTTAMTPLRHSRCNPAAKHHAATAMDEATRAMLAVFLSNFFFSLPNSIYNIWYFNHKFFSYVIMTSFFFTHLFVDPMVFVCFNQHHRRRVMKALRFYLSRSPREDMPTHDSQAIRSSSTRMSSQ
ncbi:uncharacterized protein LOC127006019 [Eriocheir sinensis]|uniref:uncharacterized protein LOC127006019 n=1 Tax=Eriocheir sinensis TaxID=95602 RepID=UPI0021C84E9A|nr:uncharacterized protein LOC127006019 [Eriocheir sinensis]